MSWISLTEADVITKLSGPEVTAMKAAALAPGQGNPLPEIIGQIITEVRGYVAANSKNTLGEAGTIPDELEGAAINRIRFELATRLPVTSLLTKAREDANTQAIALLGRVADDRFSIVPPATEAPSNEQAGGTGVEIVSAPCRQITRDSFRF